MLVPTDHVTSRSPRRGQLDGTRAGRFGEVRIDHVRYLVADLTEWTGELLDGYGFTELARSTVCAADKAPVAVMVGSGEIRVVLCQVGDGDNAASAFVQVHGDAVVDIALVIHDAAAAFEAAIRRGGRPVAAPTTRGGVVTAVIGGVGDVVHTLIERKEGVSAHALPGFVVTAAPDSDSVVSAGTGLRKVDHLAICVGAGQLDEVVRYYHEVLDFRTVFAERIKVGAQAMNSKVVQSRCGAVTLTLLEPDVAGEPGQIDDFLKNHRGPGVQHLALQTDNIVTSVAALREHGVEFLSAPSQYYGVIGERFDPTRHSLAQLSALDILADQDHSGQLFQIFARSVHSRQTFFFEIIERAGATTFGAGNVKSLYQAMKFDVARQA